MKIFFVRHGEGLDDIYNEYGGWSDRELSPLGTQVAFDLAKKLKNRDSEIDLVLTSPLKRAHQTAQIISEELECRLEDCAYLKERNTYGLLSGVNKDIAKNEYPQLVDSMKKEQYLPASERYDDFLKRVEVLLKYLRELKHETIVCVTHGYLITAIIEEHLNLVREKIEDGCILEIELNGDEIKMLSAEGITYVQDESELDKNLNLKKFKDS
jgi:broad specificity phosphatase PhoE